MYNDIIICIAIFIVAFILGIVATLYIILKNYVVLNKDGLENTWNIGASVGDTEKFPDNKKYFNDYYNHLKED